MPHDLNENMDLPLVRVADVLFTERMKKRLSKWRDELLQHKVAGPQDQGASNDLNEQFQTVFFKMRPALSLNGFTSHQLSLIRMVYVVASLSASIYSVFSFYLISHI